MHTTCSSSATRIVLAIAATSVALVLGCASDPLPLAAQAGATIALPISSEQAQEQEIGYGSTLLEQAGRYDLQRGELRFHFTATGATPSFTVTPRVITRVAPDPASTAMVGTLLASVIGISQVLALVDIPATAQPGGYTILIRRCRRAHAGGPCESISPDLPYARPFTVLPGVGTPNLNLAYFFGTTFDTTENLLNLYPYPKIVFSVTEAPAATHAVIAYPAGKMTVKGVFEEQSAGHQSIVSWHDDPSTGQIIVDLVDPTRKTYYFAIAFDLKQPPLPGDPVERVALDDIQVVSMAAYDLNGAPIASNLVKHAIR